ncbi:MAG TPA: hypothetical protein VGG16_29420, partial [Streptosporangiaceae bacterium]
VVARPGFLRRALAGLRGVRPAWRYAITVPVAAGLVAGVLVAVQPSGPATMTAELLADRAAAAAPDPAGPVSRAVDLPGDQVEHSGPDSGWRRRRHRQSHLPVRQARLAAA